MKRIKNWGVNLFKDGTAPTHSLAVIAFALSFFIPVVGFVLGFIARTQIAFSQGKYSGDRLALSAIIIAPIAQFSTLILAALFALAMVVVPGAI